MTNNHLGFIKICRFLAGLLLLLSLSIRGLAQDTTKSELNMALSDATEETEVVDKGQLQLEAGGLLTHYDSAVNSLVAQTMLRYGLFNFLELRLLVEDGKNRDYYMEETVQSTYPLAIGLKAKLYESKTLAVPSVSLLGYVNLPFTATSAEKAIYWSPLVLLAFQNQFSEKVKLDYNIGYQQEAFSTDFATLVNASLHYNFYRQIEVYAEYYAQYQQEELPNHNVGGGLSMQVSNHLGFYITAGTRIAATDHNNFEAVGLGYRF